MSLPDLESKHSKPLILFLPNIFVGQQNKGMTSYFKKNNHCLVHQPPKNSVFHYFAKNFLNDILFKFVLKIGLGFH